MGLDMYVYRLKKLTDEQVKEMTGMMADEAQDKYDLLAVPQEEKDSCEFTHILSILRSVIMKRRSYDFAKIRKDYGLRENWEVDPFGFSPEMTSFAVNHLERYVVPFEEIREEFPENWYEARWKVFDAWKDRPENRGKKARPENMKKTDVGYEIIVNESEKSISIPTKDIAEKYTVVNDVVMLCCAIKRGAYWRKDYPLQERIYEASPYTIENCGYYPLTDEMEEVINDDLTMNGDHPLHAEDGEVLVYHEWY